MSLIESSARLCVALDGGSISCALWRGGRLQRASAWRQTCAAQDWDELLALLEAHLQHSAPLPPGCSMQVSLGSRWHASLRLPWSDALLHTELASRFMQAQFSATYGASAEHALQAVDGAYGQPRLLYGAPLDLLAALQELAQKHGMRLRSVQALSAHAWRALRQRQRRLRLALLVEEERISLLQGEAGHLQAVYAEYLAGQSWLTLLPAFWRRVCLRNPELAQARQIALLNLSTAAAPSELAAPFFLSPPGPDKLGPEYASLLCQRRPRSGDADWGDAPGAGKAWPWLTPAATLLLAAALDWGQQQSAWQQAQKQAHSAPQHSVGAAQRPLQQQRALEQQAAALRQTAQQLALPLPEILLALRAPRDVKVAALSLDLSASQDRPRLLLQAQAENSAHMMQYLAWLEEQGRFKQIDLQKHETRDDGRLLFQMELWWQS